MPTVEKQDLTTMELCQAIRRLVEQTQALADDLAKVRREVEGRALPRIQARSAGQAYRNGELP